MNDIKRKIDPSALFTGLMLIAVGTLFLLDRLDIADFGYVMGTWWPMIIVLVGVPKLFHRRTIWSGLWLIAIGVWLQLVRLHLFGLTYRSSWPLLLIALGAAIALRAVFDVVPTTEEERRDS